MPHAEYISVASRGKEVTGLKEKGSGHTSLVWALAKSVDPCSPPLTASLPDLLTLKER